MGLFFPREDSLAPSTISNRSDCSVLEEQIQSPEPSLEETNSLKQRVKNNVESRDEVISQGGSLTEEGGFYQMNGGEMGRPGKRKKSRLLGAGVTAKRVKAHSD